jgi:hypothetical protein
MGTKCVMMGLLSLDVSRLVLETNKTTLAQEDPIPLQVSAHVVLDTLFNQGHASQPVMMER